MSVRENSGKLHFLSVAVAIILLVIHTLCVTGCANQSYDLNLSEQDGSADARNDAALRGKDNIDDGLFWDPAPEECREEAAKYIEAGVLESPDSFLDKNSDYYSSFSVVWPYFTEEEQREIYSNSNEASKNYLDELVKLKGGQV